MKTKIEGFESVTEKIGFETVFHDGEILRIELVRFNHTSKLFLSILTIRSQRPAEIDQSSPLYWIVNIEFFDLEDLRIEGFNHQNVIQQLVQTENNGRLGFSFDGIFGVDCAFTCQTARVVSVNATHMKCGHPALPLSPLDI